MSRKWWTEFDRQAPGCITMPLCGFVPVVGNTITNGYKVQKVYSLTKWNNRIVVTDFNPLNGVVSSGVTRSWSSYSHQNVIDPMKLAGLFKAGMIGVDRQLHGGMTVYGDNKLSEKKIPIDLSKWKNQGLCPTSGDGMYTLMWKHIRPVEVAEDRIPGKWQGNLAGQYIVGERYSYPKSMATVGPLGALKDWRMYSESGLYVGGVWAVTSEMYDLLINPKSSQGVVYIPEGILAGVYRVKRMSFTFGGDVEFEDELVEGDDVLSLL